MIIKKIFKSLIDGLSILSWLLKTSAPISVYKTYLFKIISNKKIHKKYVIQKQGLTKQINTKDFSTDWFTPHISYWLYIFDEFNFYEKDLKVLEIGSWEGMSAFFILTALPMSQITCVDTWEGSDEHKDASRFSNSTVLSNIENSFDLNMKGLTERIVKFKGKSYFFFNGEINSVYDLVYIDGSHYQDDVLIDALKGFQSLKVGGIMIFDDYLWNYYDNPMENPAAAINSFIKLKKQSIELVYFYSQLILLKIAN